jgi:hypothetical protein
MLVKLVRLVLLLRLLLALVMLSSVHEGAFSIASAKANFQAA